MTKLKMLLCGASIAAACCGQVIQDDFNGAVLNPIWQPIVYNGTITLSGGLVHLGIANPSGTYGTFPCLRVAPGLATIPSPRWIVETRIAWTPAAATPGGYTHFAATPTPVVYPCPFLETAYPGPSAPVHVRLNDGGTIHVKAGATTMDVGPIDSALHTYRWVSDGVSVAFSLDGVPAFSGAYDGNQPNNLWIGNPCAAATMNWPAMDVDLIRITWDRILDAPATAPVGTTIAYHLAMPALSPYLLDVSVAGTSPGFFYAPAGITIPLNPPFLASDYGALLPGVFVNFSATSDSVGLASAALNVPAEPALAGIAVSATYVTLDASAPGGVSGLAYPATTVLGP